MLSSRNEWIVVGVLIVYLAFIPSLQMVRDVLSTSVGKAAALAAIIYVHKYISCPVALLLVIAYVRCSRSFKEMLENPPPPMNTPPTTSPSPLSMPPSPTEPSTGTMVNTMPPTTGPGAPIDTTPGVSTVPMTTPTATMPPMMPANTSGGVQPSTSSSSSAAPL